MQVLRKTGSLTALAAGIALAITGCASSPDKIAAAYTSPIQYQNHSCSQVSSEMERINRRASDLHGSLKKKADDDSAQMAIGMVLFWPALFFLEGGDGPEAAEYARLKGEREALERVALEKNCSIPKTPEGVKTTTEAAKKEGAS